MTLSPGTLTKREFAAHIGVRPGYVTQLGREERIVLTPDRRRVVVQASIERIEATRDPARAAQRRRWADYRAARDGSPTARPGEPADPEAPPPASDEVGSYQVSRARKEHFQALQAEIEYKRAAAELCESAAVKRAAARAGAHLRTALERQPERLAPVLAPVTDEGKLRVLLTEHFEAELNELADVFARAVGELEERR